MSARILASPLSRLQITLSPWGVFFDHFRKFRDFPEIYFFTTFCKLSIISDFALYEVLFWGKNGSFLAKILTKFSGKFSEKTRKIPKKCPKIQVKI